MSDKLVKQDPFSGVYRARAPEELEEMFMDPNAPKTEAEDWAVREIERLRADLDLERSRIVLQRGEIERLRGENERLRAEVAHGHLAHKAACEGGELLCEEIKRLREVIRTIRARCVEMDDSDAVSETLDIASAALEGKR